MRAKFEMTEGCRKRCENNKSENTEKEGDE